MNLRPRLSYANVAATIALVLALGGGTVYAASHLGKNSVKSKNIAKGAVKGADLAKNAVTSPKVKDGSIEAGDLATDLLTKIQSDVTASASAGPISGLNTATETPIQLNGTTTFTPHAGEVAAITAEAKFTTASANPPQFCSPSVFLFLNGQETRVFVSPDTDANTATPVTSSGRDADGPYGLVNPEQPQTITAFARGDADCTAGTRIDDLQIRVLQFK
jgi:hypothetical protein